MAKFGVTNISGGGGIGSDEVSATKDYVLSGKTYVGADTSDEIGIGTMDNNGTTGNQSINAGSSFLVKKGYHAQNFSVGANSLASQTSATAAVSDILSGKTAWVNGNKITGSITLQSILSFSCSPYSASQILFTWQNPASGPFSGVIIVGKTGGYPTSITDGTRYYKGFGNNSNASGTSNTTVNGFDVGITYYFKAFSYMTVNGQEWISEKVLTSNISIQQITQIYTTSQIYEIPSNVYALDVFCVGGGASGSKGNSNYAGSGGGSGYTATVKGLSVVPGQQFQITIGSGGKGVTYSSSFQSGGTTSFGAVLSASGGKSQSGGSGGGIGNYDDGNDPKKDYQPTSGGYDGSDGVSTYTNGGSLVTAGTGQHTTTRAFGESNNTLYAGGGSGGYYGNGTPGGGGSGQSYSLTDATANTGSGGGGYSSKGGNGASGICIIRYIK